MKKFFIFLAVISSMTIANVSFPADQTNWKKEIKQETNYGLYLLAKVICQYEKEKSQGSQVQLPNDHEKIKKYLEKELEKRLKIFGGKSQEGVILAFALNKLNIARLHHLKGLEMVQKEKRAQRKRARQKRRER